MTIAISGSFYVTSSFARELSKSYISDFNPKIFVDEEHIQNLPIIHGNYVTWVDSRLNDNEGRIFPRIYMKHINSDEEKFAMSFAKKSGARTQYKNKVVWAENTDRLRDDNFDIKMFDYDTGQITSITKNKRMQNNPQISKEFIIWKDMRDTQRGSTDIWDFAIFGSSVEKNEEFVVKPHDTPGTAELFGRYAAMSIKREDASDRDIYLNILSSGKEIPICIESGDQFNPKVIGDVVIWEDARYAPVFGLEQPTDIFAYSISKHKELFVSTDPQREYGLTVGADRYALWYQDTSGMNASNECTIHLYDAVADSRIVICEEPGDYRNAVIGKDWIIWEDHSSVEFGIDLVAYQISTKETFDLMKAFGDQKNPKIYDNYVVWENIEGQESESGSIWCADLIEFSEKKSTFSGGFKDTVVWTQAHGNENKNGFVRSEIRNPNQFRFDLQWKIKLDGSITSSPSFDRRGFGYIGTSTGKLYKYSAFSGEIVWELKLDGAIKASPAIYKDRLFIGTCSGKFYAISTDLGEEIWSEQKSGSIESSPTVYLSENDHYPMVVFSSMDKMLHLYGVRGSKPNLKWSIPLDGWVKGSVSVDENPLLRSSDQETVKKYLYVGLSSNYLICIDPLTSEIISRFETDSPMKGSIIANSSTCICASNDGTLYSISFNGWGRKPQLIYAESTYHKTLYSPAFDPVSKRIFFEGKPGAISSYIEKELWSLTLDKELASAPVITHYDGKMNGVFVVSTNGLVSFLEPETGKIIWKTTIDTVVSSSLSVFDTGFITIFLGGNDSYLYCWGQRPLDLDY